MENAADTSAVRILVVNPTLGTGGAERLAIQTAGALVRHGHAVRIAFSEADELEPEAQDAGVTTVRLGDRELSTRSLPAWRTALRRAIVEFGPDVLHAHSVTAALACRLAAPRTPLLATVHGIAETDERRAALLLRAADRVTAVSAASANGIASRVLGPHVEVLRVGVDADPQHLDVRAEHAGGDAVRARG